MLVDKPLEEYKGIHPTQDYLFVKGHQLQGCLENYKDVYPPSSPLFVSQTLGSKRAYTPRFFVDQALTSKVILLHGVLLREVKGLTPS